MIEPPAKSIFGSEQMKPLTWDEREQWNRWCLEEQSPFSASEMYRALRTIDEYERAAFIDQAGGGDDDL